uniref:Uncharacterized protein n=1 Tax=Molossus molossus TaxID=27622 RepID=A0A7J8CRU1_MOLMO|nr:hypothetical protein HJG59_009772 [Molossus molossus]
MVEAFPGQAPFHDPVRIHRSPAASPCLPLPHFLPAETPNPARPPQPSFPCPHTPSCASEADSTLSHHPDVGTVSAPLSPVQGSHSREAVMEGQTGAKKESPALAGWLSWLEHPIYHRVAGLIPGGLAYRMQPIHVSLSHRCFSLLFSPLNISLGEDLKKQTNKKKPWPVWLSGWSVSLWTRESWVRFPLGARNQKKESQAPSVSTPNLVFPQRDFSPGLA